MAWFAQPAYLKHQVHYDITAAEVYSQEAGLLLKALAVASVFCLLLFVLWVKGKLACESTYRGCCLLLLLTCCSVLLCPYCRTTE